jgi:hypothetical protein
MQAPDDTLPHVTSHSFYIMATGDTSPHTASHPFNTLVTGYTPPLVTSHFFYIPVSCNTPPLVTSHSFYIQAPGDTPWCGLSVNSLSHTRHTYKCGHSFILYTDHRWYTTKFCVTSFSFYVLATGETLPHPLYGYWPHHHIWLLIHSIYWPQVVHHYVWPRNHSISWPHVTHVKMCLFIHPIYWL